MPSADVVDITKASPEAAKGLRESVVTSSWIVLVLFGASIEPILVKFGYRGLVTPFQLFFLKTSFSLLFILPFLRKWKWIGIKKAGQIASVSLQLLFTSGMTILSLKYLPAVMVITILTTTPALVALVNQKLGRDVLNAKFWLGFLLAFAGVALTLEFHSLLWQLQGLACVMAAVVSSVIYRTRMESLTQAVPPMLVSIYVFLINGIVALLVFSPFVGQIPKDAWPIGAWMGAAAAIANIAFLYAIYRLGSTRVSVITMLERPTVIILAAILLKEAMTPIQIAGIVMVLIGTQLAKVKRTQLPDDRVIAQVTESPSPSLVNSLKN
jgi:drug/metabolite transporter (DMT)-like permease